MSEWALEDAARDLLYVLREHSADDAIVRQRRIVEWLERWKLRPFDQPALDRAFDDGLVEAYRSIRDLAEKKLAERGRRDRDDIERMEGIHGSSWFPKDMLDAARRVYRAVRVPIAWTGQPQCFGWGRSDSPTRWCRALLSFSRRWDFPVVHGACTITELDPVWELHYPPRIGGGPGRVEAFRTFDEALEALADPERRVELELPVL